MSLLARAPLMAFALFCWSAALAAPPTVEPATRCAEAIETLDAIMLAPDRELPEDMLRNAHAVAVFPHVWQAGLVFAGRRGRGVLAVRKGDSWSAPSFVRLAGASLGVQAGVSSTDLIVIFRSERGVASIVDGTFIFGTDLTFAAGPVGRSAQASTDAGLKAEIYAYSRSRGLFAGFALQGARLRIDANANHAMYGPGADARAILADGVPVPGAAARFRDSLSEYTRR